MADEFQLGSGSWWDSSRNRFDSGTTPASSISTTLNAIASYGWPTELVDMKNRSSMDSASASRDGSMVFQGGQNESSAGGSGGGNFLANPNMQMMGLGLSSQNMNWHQALLGERSENSFRSFLQQDSSSSSGNHQQKLYADASSENEFKPINRGFSLDHQSQFRSQASSNDSMITSQNLTTAFQFDSSAAAYGLLLSENQQQQQQSAYQNRQILNYPYASSCYETELMPASNKYPQFLIKSPPKPPQAAAAGDSHLNFTNNTPFWNASAPPTAMTDARSSYFPALQSSIPAAPSFDEKPKNKSSAARDHGATMKKNNTEISNKRSRNETPSPSPLPAFKVKKEKMGDRITALQQLVSPFGKTDTASVLSEAIEYIKFLHEQVGALSAPYMKNGAPMQNQQNSDKPKDSDAPRHDLRSRGLCLAPVSSTYPVTHEAAVDFWTPTLGGTFR